MSLAAKAPLEEWRLSSALSTAKHYQALQHGKTPRDLPVTGCLAIRALQARALVVQIAGRALAGRIAAQVQDLEQIAVAMAARHRCQPRKQQPEEAPATVQTVGMLQQA